LSAAAGTIGTGAALLFEGNQFLKPIPFDQVTINA